MRAALSAIAQWFRDAWNLPWKWKGPFLGVLAVVIALLVTVTLIVAGDGGDNTSVSGVVQAPTPTATAEPTSTPTPRPTHTAAPTLTPSPSPPLPAPPAPAAPAPPPAPEAGLTAAEVIECEFGQFDGWDDGFNLRPHGFTPSPASLKLTTDPVACEDLWLTAYDDGYSRGSGDKCGLVSEYPSVSSSEELGFCGVDVQSPLPPGPLLVSAEAAIIVTDWYQSDDSFGTSGSISNCSAQWAGSWWEVTCLESCGFSCISGGIAPFGSESTFCLFEATSTVTRCD